MATGYGTRFGGKLDAWRTRRKRAQGFSSPIHLTRRRIVGGSDQDTADTSVWTDWLLGPAAPPSQPKSPLPRNFGPFLPFEQRVLGYFAPAGGGTTFFQSVGGDLGFAGNVQKQTNKNVSGTATFVGVLQKETRVSRSGVLSFTGAIQKQTNKNLDGVLSFSGALAASVVSLLDLAGSLDFVGTLQKMTAKNLSGSVGFAGSVQKQTTKMVSGVLSFTGSLATARIAAQALAAVLSFVGALATLFIPGSGTPPPTGGGGYNAFRRKTFEEYWKKRMGRK